ncbi:ATP-dependent nuclease [Stenotrophomonas maltophilia]|uniref:ATP-dependent nuclease n=1 Tax=Stenotrophomonas maltophilia TaxID=40324 RepID=UPI0015F5EE92|nr:ATP-binding protein [Stenotrophomonas maltophilia]
MPITAIRIHGYRGFSTPGELLLAVPNGSPGSGLTLITGPNNSGKSTILEALRARAGDQPVSFTVGTRNSAVESVTFEYVVGDKTESIRSLTKGSSETIRDFDAGVIKVFSLPSRRAFSPYFGKSVYNREQFRSSSILEPQRSSTLSNFESRLFHVLSNPGEFNSLLARILGYAPEWTIDQSDQGYYFLKFFSGKHSHSSDGMGEGIISAFAIADALYDSQAGEVIAIDEPELSLHPALQRRLADVLMDQAKDKQIIVATHSPYLVNLKALSAGGALARVVTGENGTEIHQIGQRGRAAIGVLVADNLSNPHIMGLDARELFFQEDRVLLTEGQEDVLLYPRVFEQLGLTMPATLFGWGAGGAGNIKHLCAVLHDLGFSRVGALFDDDKAADCTEARAAFTQYRFDMIPAKDVKTKKARKNGDEVVPGLLDEKYQLREELRAAAEQVVNAMVDYFNAG